MCTRDHLQKQCSFPQIRATLKPKSKTLKMLCVLNTVYVYIYIYNYSILFIFFSKTKKCTSLTAFPHLNASWSDLPLSLFQANFWICEDRVRLPTFCVQFKSNICDARSCRSQQKCYFTIVIAVYYANCVKLHQLATVTCGQEAPLFLLVSLPNT